MGAHNGTYGRLITRAIGYMAEMTHRFALHTHDHMFRPLQRD